MNLFQAIETRYSHKETFLPNPIPLANLQRIAHAGLAAPSGNNSQQVKLVILPDRAAVEPFYGIHQNKALQTAPAGIALLTDNAMVDERKRRWNFEKEDYAAACQNMLLAATALGYASLWLDSPFFDEGKQNAALALLNAPEGCHLYALLPIGLPNGEGTRREKLPYEERLFYGKF